MENGKLKKRNFSSAEPLINSLEPNPNCSPRAESISTWVKKPRLNAASPKRSFFCLCSVAICSTCSEVSNPFCKKRSPKRPIFTGEAAVCSTFSGSDIAILFFASCFIRVRRLKVPLQNRFEQVLAHQIRARDLPRNELFVVIAPAKRQDSDRTRDHQADQRSDYSS